MIGSNIYQLRKYEGYQWCYTKQFESPALKKEQRVLLRFGGIDCLSDIWLNGIHIGSTDNMLIEQNFDVTDFLSSNGKNTLNIVIRSSVIEAQKYILGTFSIGCFASGESIFIRKAPHCYGWDIMPRLVSAGLWRDVTLCLTSTSCLVNVNWMTVGVDLKNKSAVVCTDVQLKAPLTQLDKLRARFSLSREGQEVYSKTVPVSSNTLRNIFNLQNSEFWWPRGYGEASLYDAEVALVDENDSVLSCDKQKIGLRTIRLDRSDINEPENPGRFCFLINGEKIFVRGTNWVPMDAFHSRDRLWIDKTIQLVADLNCNMIRCWGGNVYEDHHFFDLCDKEGIMVWQDFAMGCAFYPQRQSFAEKIEKEVTSVVLKLRNHPSIVLWSGNNEDDASLRWTLVNFNINPNKDVISREVIPRVLYEFDPTRPYLPSSPYYSQRVYEQGSMDENLPENHLWGPRGYYKDAFYTQAKSQFVSEIGYHGCPNKTSLEKMFTKKSVYPWVKDHIWNEEWLTKSVRISPSSTQTMGRNDLMINQIEKLFGTVPDNLDDFITCSQIVQAEAMKYFIESWRGAKFDRTGIIWWNVKDGWPIISDAIVDYYFSKKLAYYFIKNSQRNICLFINDAVNDTLPLVAVNDTRVSAKGKVKVTDVKSGNIVFNDDFNVDANGKAIITSIPELSGQGILLIEYEVDGQTYKNHYLYGQPIISLKDYLNLIRKTKIYDI